jgi:anaerobic magnesium-protoporphyrin IX monomethyl ester cyclase
MSEITLIIPPSKYPERLGYHKYEKHPLTGISEIRGVLLEDGHDVQVLDCRAIHSPYEYVAKHVNKDADIIGLTTLFDSYSYVCQFVKCLREIVKNPLFIAGGPSASGAPLPFLKEAGIDIVVHGEGEIAVRMLAQHRAALAKIPGISFLTEDGHLKGTGTAQIVHDLDSLPPIDWSYAGLLSSNTMEFMYTIGRGCKNRCTYCLANAKLRRKSPERVKNELIYLMSDFGLRDIILTDSDFLVQRHDLQAYLQIFDDLGLKWGCFTVPQDLTSGLLNELAGNGCANIRIGVESFDEITLRLNRPHISLPNLYKSLDALQNSTIERITACLLVGLPGQTDRALRETVEAIEKRPRLIPRPFCLLPLPGSNLFVNACKNGAIPDAGLYLQSLKDVPIDRYSKLLPNLSSASPKCMNETVEDLMEIANRRSKEREFSIPL